MSTKRYEVYWKMKSASTYCYMTIIVPSHLKGKALDCSIRQVAGISNMELDDYGRTEKN